MANQIPEPPYEFDAEHQTPMSSWYNKDTERPQESRRDFLLSSLTANLCAAKNELNLWYNRINH